MEINSQVLEAVLRKYAKSDKELYTSLDTISEEEFNNELQKMNLANYTQRDDLYWNLQVVVEKCVSEVGGLDDNETIAENIVEAWNQTQELKITQSIAQSFIYTLNLKFPNTRKSFIAICDGDIQSYKAFNSKPRLFIDLLIRYVICLYGKQRIPQFLRLTEEIMSLLFDEITKNDCKDSFERLGYYRKKGLNFGKMNAYRRKFSLDDLVYADGMKVILLEALTETKDSELLAQFKDKISQPPMAEQGSEAHRNNEQIEVDEDYQVEYLLAENMLESNTPLPNEGPAFLTNIAERTVDNEEESRGVGVDSRPDQVIEVHDGAYTEAAVVPEETEVHKSIENNPTKNTLATLEEALKGVQTALNEAKQLRQREVESTKFYQHQVRIAEEEIERLNVALLIEKEKVAQAEEKAYIKILQAIGGENSKYLLSDLFEESQGKIPSNPNISIGRLVNLFSSLSLAIGLEEHSHFREIGEVFTINKDELIKNYQTDGPIDEDGDDIRVKLLKYGWTINGKLVVPPLVTEVKEES